MSVVVKVQYLITGISFKKLLKAIISSCSQRPCWFVCRKFEELSGGDKQHEHLC